MSRLSGIATIIYAAALAIGLMVDNSRYVFSIAALIIFGFLAVGFFLFPKLKAIVPFSLGPIGSSDKSKKVLVAGTEVPSSDFPQHFTCVFQLRSWLLLVALAALSIGAFCLLVSNFYVSSLFEGSLIFSLYLFSLFTLLALWISTKWYSEQALLARSIVTFGTVTGVNQMGSHRVIRYEFRDAAGGYFGGTERDFVSRQVDHVVFVMYDHSDPDKNSSSRGFLFRSFTVYPQRQVIEDH
jgi:hypothetical protein